MLPYMLREGRMDGQEEEIREIAEKSRWIPGAESGGAGLSERFWGLSERLWEIILSIVLMMKARVFS